MRFILILTLSLFIAPLATAKVNVITSITDLAWITAQVGGDQVEVSSIAKGSQDPHFIEAKPSYMIKAAKADLVVSIGLGLEVGWLPSILRGARNPKLFKEDGHLEVGPLCHPIEIPAAGVSRAQGDVHPDGNPHVTLSPINVGRIAQALADRLSALDPSHSALFHENAQQLESRMKEKLKNWKERIQKSGVKEVVTYHKTLDYFLKEFDIEIPITLEPKPGIPPTSRHIIEVIQTVKQKKVPLILVENFFDEKQAERIKQDVPSVRILSVPVAVEGEPGIHSMDDLFEKLVTVIEGK
jgi:zinc/manganese transport system substrate-binding protein